MGASIPCHVLVVEDDDALRESLSELLEEEGLRVTCAVNGRDALRLLDELLPRLILLDLMMPVMNGWEFRQEQLRSPRLAPIPVVLFSGAGNVEERARSLAADAYLPKPVDIPQLLNVVDRFCRF